MNDIHGFLTTNLSWWHEHYEYTINNSRDIMFHVNNPVTYSVGSGEVLLDRLKADIDYELRELELT